MDTKQSDNLDADLVLISGGTAMKATSRVLKQYTTRSLHLLSPFDSGGSTAALRRYFALPAMGDLRSRLAALASDEELSSGRAQCLSLRLSDGCAGDHWLEQCFSEARTWVQADDSWGDLLEETRRLAQQLPADFSWPGTSFGNLMIAAAMQAWGTPINSVAAELESLLSTRGHARCVSNANLHLSARLSDGRHQSGQHRLTGKGNAPIKNAIEELRFCAGVDDTSTAQCALEPDLRQAICAAKLVILCPGSFYTSLLAQLMPEGTTVALAASRAEIVYVPNLGEDPELLGQSPQSALLRLQETLRPARLNKILMDLSQAPDFANSGHELVSKAIASPDGTAHQPHALASAIMDLL